MPAFSAIARAAITRSREAVQAGVTINIPLSIIVLSVPANDIVAGTLIDIALSSFDFTAPANAPSGGTIVDVPSTQLVMTAPVNAGAGGASVDTRSLNMARRGRSIAGGAITQPPLTYVYRSGSHLIFGTHANDVISGSLIDIALTDLVLSAATDEVVARSRAVRSILISS